MSLLDKKLEEIRTWLVSKARGEAIFTDDCDIIEMGLLNSLLFMEFIYFIERTSEREIDVSNLEFKDFSTINKIKNQFLNHV